MQYRKAEETIDRIMLCPGRIDEDELGFWLQERKTIFMQAIARHEESNQRQLPLETNE